MDAMYTYKKIKKIKETKNNKFWTLISVAMGGFHSRQREGADLFRHENKKIAKQLGFKENSK